MWMLALAMANEAPPPPAAVVERVQYTSVVLANDLHVVVAVQPAWKTVSIATVIDGGLVSEPRAGLSHALADGWMASNPTGSGDVESLYDRLGAESRVRVEPESTVFWVHGPAGVTDTLLALERQRLIDPLARLRSPAVPTRPTVHDGFTALYLQVVFASLYPEPHPYHAIWQAPGGLELPLHAASDFAASTWTPARTTLLVAGPVEPSRVLCAMDATWCGTEPELSEAQAPLELPAPVGLPEASELPVPVNADVGPVSAGVPAPAVLIAWSLPGLDDGAQQIGRFARERVERALSNDSALPMRSLSRCHLYEGRQNTTLICVVRANADLDLSKLRRHLRRGWPKKDLDAATDSWRGRQLGGLVGASGDAAHTQRMAEYFHRSQVVDVHGGALEALAFDAADVRQFLDRVLAEERMVVVRLVP